jgi:hypothetical protein
LNWFLTAPLGSVVSIVCPIQRVQG